MKSLIFKFFSIFLVCSLLINCNTNGGETKLATFGHGDSTKVTTNQSKVAVKQNIDTVCDNIAKFVAGIPTKQFAEIQKKDYYLQHIKKVEEIWATIDNKELKSIKNWIDKKAINDVNDSSTLFYPFSGPDFLFANAFFPHCKTYLMFGLENPGNLPKLGEIPDKMLDAYLDTLRASLRHTVKYGFFVTSQMHANFRSRNLDGMLHVVLFYLARTNHEILGYSPFEIDAYGKMIKILVFEFAGQRINGISINFRKVGEKIEKQLIYIPIDVSDENLKDKFEFLTFLTHFDNKTTFIKSASYLLHRNNFSILNRLIRMQSRKILQDDTGIQYADLKPTFNVKLFGTYTRTIKLFEGRFQADLRKSLEKEGDTLPFYIGYNASHKETVMLYATQLTKEQIQEKEMNKAKVVYKVQFRSSSKKLKLEELGLKGIPNLDYYFSDGLYRYTAGNESSEADCDPIKKAILAKGYKEAFVVAFFNNNRIPIEEARKK